MKLAYSMTSNNFNFIKVKLHFMKMLKKFISNSRESVLYMRDVDTFLAEGVVASLKKNNGEFLVALLYD